MEKHKLVLITGGSRGLGKNMALQVAAKGMDVIITYKGNREQALHTVKEIENLGQKAAALFLDMSDFKSLKSFVLQVLETTRNKWSRSSFDVLVNNAGMGATVPFIDVTEELFNEFMDVHFKGVYFLSQYCIPYLTEGGSIINISSGTTRFSNPGYSVYASMKGAVEVFTRYLAKELGSKNIRANVVAPGPIETDFNNAAIKSNPQLKEMLGSITPLGRVGLPEDIGGVVAFLCVDEARWINGQRIEVSGGINC